MSSKFQVVPSAIFKLVWCTSNIHTTKTEGWTLIRIFISLASGHDLFCDGNLQERTVPAALAGAAELQAQCCGQGSLYQIPDPNFSIPDPGQIRSLIRIRIEEFKYI
jgi:hypothetical protein